MRILFVSHTGAASGAEYAMLRLCAGLAEDHDVAVACPPGGRLEAALRERSLEMLDLSGTELSFGLHPVETPRGLLRLLRSAAELRRIARRFGADVIHANTVRAGLIAVAARRLGGPPVVVQCHDDLPRSRTGQLTRVAIARGADAVVAVSDHTAARFNEGLRRLVARTVYISVDSARFFPALRGSSEIRSELALPASATLLAHVAQLSPWKGQDTAIRALGQLRERFDAHLLVIGDVVFASRRYDNYGYRDSLRGLTAELDLQDAVHFLGQRGDVPALMGAADMLVLPSEDEPFGLSVAEAMTIGTPVLVTSEGGVAEYVEDGVNGRVLPPGDPSVWTQAIAELIAEPERLAEMSRHNVEKAGLFKDERYTREMLAVYTAAVGEGSHGAPRTGVG